MNPPVPPGPTLQLGALCCALLWGFTAAQSPPSALQPATRLPQAQMMRAECSASGGKPVARTELFFGLARPHGAVVSSEAFQQFVDREVTTRFPEGLTVLGGNGQFRNASGDTIRETAKVLILLYPHDGEHSRNIEAIRAAYATAFEQESVLRVDGSSCVSF